MQLFNEFLTQEPRTGGLSPAQAALLVSTPRPASVNLS